MVEVELKYIHAVLVVDFRGMVNIRACKVVLV